METLGNELPNRLEDHGIDGQSHSSEDFIDGVVGVLCVSRLDGTPLEIQFTSLDTIYTLKKKLEGKIAARYHQMSLIVGETILENDVVLVKHGLTDRAQLSLVISEFPYCGTFEHADWHENNTRNNRVIAAFGRNGQVGTLVEEYFNWFSLEYQLDPYGGPGRGRCWDQHYVGTIELGEGEHFTISVSQCARRGTFSEAQPELIEGKRHECSDQECIELRIPLDQECIELRIPLARGGNRMGDEIAIPGIQSLSLYRTSKEPDSTLFEIQNTPDMYIPFGTYEFWLKPLQESTFDDIGEREFIHVEAAFTRKGRVGILVEEFGKSRPEDLSRDVATLDASDLVELDVENPGHIDQC